MAGTKEKYIISKMSTVLIINFDGMAPPIALVRLRMWRFTAMFALYY
jgi:hypothetical protein